MTTSLSAAAAAAATASEKAAATIAADARQRLLRLHHQHQQQQKARGGAAKAAGRGGSQEGREEAEPAAHHDAVDGDHGRGYHAFAAADLAPLRASLLAWYDAHRRDLPWRKPSPRFLPRVDATVPPASSSSSRRPAPPSDPQDDPDLRSRLGQRAYEVWVSEIMLQQTQVVTVIDYYNRWMATWPTVFDLAKADLEAVNQKWSGLGYYSRARRLLAAAQKVVSKFDGILPSDVVALQKEVPGVGRYTAGAISSIAFNEPQPIVDGNVVRVVSRLRAIGGDPKSKAAVSLHWKLAEDLVDPDRPGDFNQAMMELGATVCTPQNPSCQGCPVAAFCRALAEVPFLCRPFPAHPHAFLTPGRGRGVFFSSLHVRFRKKSKAHAAIAKENLSGSGTLRRTSKRDNHTNGLSDNSGDNPSRTQNEDLVQCDLCQPLDIEDFAVTRYPAAVKRKAAREEDCFVVILEYAETDDTPPSYLLIQRPKSGLLPNLWDFPHVRTPKKAIADDDEEREEEKEEEAAESEPAGPLGAAAATRLLQETVGIRLDDGASVTVRERRDLGTAVHVFSHIRWSMRVELVRVGPGTAGRGRPEPVVVATARGAGGGGGSRTRGVAERP
ncbi:DNA glycosylase, partial [Zopfochytrium polystomum]